MVNVDGRRRSWWRRRRRFGPLRPEDARPAALGRRVVGRLTVSPPVPVAAASPAPPSNRRRRRGRGAGARLGLPLTAMFRPRPCGRAVPSAGVECVLGLPRATLLSHGRHSAVVRTQRYSPQLSGLRCAWTATALAPARGRLGPRGSRTGANGRALVCYAAGVHLCAAFFGIDARCLGKNLSTQATRRPRSSQITNFEPRHAVSASIGFKAQPVCFDLIQKSIALRARAAPRKQWRAPAAAPPAARCSRSSRSRLTHRTPLWRP